MSAPSAYRQSVAVPLPSDGDVRAVIGQDYDATRVPLETTDKVGSRTGPLG